MQRLPAGLRPRLLAKRCMSSGAEVQHALPSAKAKDGHRARA